jgi:hypothetical protein
MSVISRVEFPYAGQLIRFTVDFLVTSDLSVFENMYTDIFDHLADIGKGNIPFDQALAGGSNVFRQDCSKQGSR